MLSIRKDVDTECNGIMLNATIKEYGIILAF